MRLCLISADPDPEGESGASVLRLARLLAEEHEVTVLHAFEAGARPPEPGDPPNLRRLVADPSRVPPVAFACEDHARSAALVLAIEDAYGEAPPDYLEVPDRGGLGLVPLQAKDGGNRSLRDCTIAVRLHGSLEAECMHDGTWRAPENRILFDFEREVLRLADLTIEPGGDALALYRRVLGTEPAPAERVRLPLEPPAEPPRPDRRAAGEPLRILYVGPLQRAKGVLDLVEACTRLDSDDWRLEILGADTSTGPMGASMQATIETMCAGDRRVDVRGEAAPEQLAAAFARNDVLALPSKFEVWPSVALEAMRAGLPILATPVGGLTEIVADGVTGRLVEGTGRAAIQRGLERLLGEGEELERMRTSGEVFRRFQLLTADEPVVAAYRALPGRSRPAPRQPSAEPSVTGIVTYYGEREWVGDAVDSLLAQTHRNLTVTIVNDGCFAPEDAAVLAELAEDPRVRVLHQLGDGEQSGRNLALIDAEGDYVAMLDADNLYEPELVERAVAMLEADPQLAYVTCWLRFFGERAAIERTWTEGFAPLGNGVRSDESINSDGDTIAVMPRRIFAELGYRYDELTGMATDWALYRVLRDDGRYGAVIPERLARYRVRDDSISHYLAAETHTSSWDETLSLRRARRLQWARPA